MGHSWTLYVAPQARETPSRKVNWKERESPEVQSLCPHARVVRTQGCQLFLHIFL